MTGNRIILMLHERAAQLTDELAKEIRTETNINCLLTYTNARQAVILEMLDAVAILRKAGL